MDIRSIPFIAKLFPGAGIAEAVAVRDNPASYTAHEICESIEQLLEMLVTERHKNVDWRRHSIEGLHRQDNFSAPYIAHLTRHYLALPPFVSSVSGRFLAAISGYWEEMSEIHLQCVSYQLKHPEYRLDALLPLLIQRALYHHAMQFKWLWMRYQVIPACLWARLHRLYVIAEKRGFARMAMPLPGTEHSDTSCEILYLRTQLLSSLRPDTLLPREIEQVDEWIARWGKSVILERTLQPEKHRYGVNLKSANPPRPLAILNEPGSYRYWGVGLMLAAMHADSDEADAASQDGWRQALWRKMVNGWSGIPATRRLPRRAIGKATELFLGFNEIHTRIDYRPARGMHTLPRAQRCRLRDESAEGLGIALNTLDGVQVAINSLIGINFGRHFLVGVVTRIRRHESGWTEIGIRRLAANAVSVKLESVNMDQGEQAVEALYLSMTGAFGRRRCVLIPARINRHGSQWRLVSKGRRHLIRLRAPLKATQDYVLASFDALAEPEAAAS